MALLLLLLLLRCVSRRRFCCSSSSSSSCCCCQGSNSRSGGGAAGELNLIEEEFKSFELQQMCKRSSICMQQGTAAGGPQGAPSLDVCCNSSCSSRCCCSSRNSLKVLWIFFSYFVIIIAGCLLKPAFIALFASLGCGRKRPPTGAPSCSSSSSSSSRYSSSSSSCPHTQLGAVVLPVLLCAVLCLGCLRWLINLI